MSTSKPSKAYTFTKSSKGLDDFAANLKTALDSVLPSSGTFYEKVSVIAFHWANDDMGVDALESQLLAVFRDTYNYDTEAYVIPVALSQISLTNKLNDWSVDCMGEDTLRIYVYSGHGASAGMTAERSWFIGSVYLPSRHLICVTD